MYNWSGRHAPDWDEPGAGLYPLRHGHIPQRSQEGGNILQEIHKNLSIIFLKKNTGCFKKMLLTDFLALFLLGKCLNKKQYFLNP